MIKDDVKTLSNAFDLLIQGMDNPRGVVINMDTFGKYNKAEDICYGCAATLALQQLTKVRYYDAAKQYSSRPRRKMTDIVHASWACLSSRTKYSYDDIAEFEEAIDFLRQGSVGRMQRFLGLDYLFEIGLPKIYEDNWPEVRQNYVNARDQLRAMGR